MALRKRGTPEINASSMADIAFLLMCFFLVTTTFDVDTGIFRRLPPPIDPSIKRPEINDRNIFLILVNKNDRLLVEGKPSELSMLKDQTKEFLANPANLPTLPEKRMEFIPGIGDYPISRGVISLKNDRGTSYDMYIQVQNALTQAINELRDELSKEKFGVKFAALTDTALINAVQRAIPVPISEAEPEDVGGD